MSDADTPTDAASDPDREAEHPPPPGRPGEGAPSEDEGQSDEGGDSDTT